MIGSGLYLTFYTRIRGALAIRLRSRVHHILWRPLWSLLWRVLLVWLVLTLSVTVALRYIDPPFWSWMLWRAVTAPEGYPEQHRHEWVNLDAIPLQMQLAVVAAEDQRFPLHQGVDFRELEQAVRDAMAGKALRGASTLTQQTAKNLFLWPGRDWTRKGLELPLALLLEQVWGKRRTLEVYLNIVEFGPGVYGVGAASEYWYGKPVQRLSEVEAARLAAVLPNPWIYRAEPASAYVRQRQQWILQQMKQLGPDWVTQIQ